MLLFRHVDCHHLIDHAARGERLDDRWSLINARCSDKTYIERRRQDLNPVVCVLGVSGEKGETAVWEAGEKDIRMTTNEANASKNKYSFDRVQLSLRAFFRLFFFRRRPTAHRVINRACVGRCLLSISSLFWETMPERFTWPSLLCSQSSSICVPRLAAVRSSFLRRPRCVLLRSSHRNWSLTTHDAPMVVAPKSGGPFPDMGIYGFSWRGLKPDSQSGCCPTQRRRG